MSYSFDNVAVMQMKLAGLAVVANNTTAVSCARNGHCKCEMTIKSKDAVTGNGSFSIVNKKPSDVKGDAKLAFSMDGEKYMCIKADCTQDSCPVRQAWLEAVTRMSENPSAAPGCFPGCAPVSTPDGDKLMKDLSIGDFVAVFRERDSSTSEFAEVIGFLHHEPSSYLLCTTLTVENNRTVSVTANHMIFAKQGRDIDSLPVDKAVGALKVGENVFILEQGSNTLRAAPINSIQDVSLERGIYCPLTSTGTILVNGIAFSCFASCPHWLGLHFLKLYRVLGTSTKNPSHEAKHGVNDLAKVSINRILIIHLFNI